MTNILERAKKDMAELGQGGIDRLHAHELAWAAYKENPGPDTLKALDDTLTELHKYGAYAYIELGLKLMKPGTETGAAEEVILAARVGGSGGKDDDEG